MKYKNRDLTKIKERIHGLLNMTVENGCTVAEADVARQKAERLLYQFGLKMETVQTSNWVTIRTRDIITEGQLQRAYCERSSTKSHYYMLDGGGQGKCRFCGRPHGIKDWAPIFELSLI